jgi:glucose-1-phosphate adenylyltransferase
MESVIGIVLGGGQGKRLYPLTKLRSKPAVPLAGKYRIIDIPISNCLNSEINRIFVLTQFNSASLNRHIVQTYKFDMFGEGFVDILAAEQTPDNPDWFQGTADAVRQCIKHFARYDVDYVLVLSGDQLYRMDFRKMIRFHAEMGADTTVAALPVSAEMAPGLGIMKVESNGRVVGFTEKPRTEALHNLSHPPLQSPPNSAPDGREYLASMGIYVFQKDFLIDLLLKSTAIDFGKELFPETIGKHKVYSYMFNGYWTDIGTIRSYYEANMDLTANLPRFSFYEAKMPIYTHARNLPSSKMNNCTVHHSIIAEGSILNGSDVRHSIIGVRSRIGTGTTIKDSILMGADRFETTDEMADNRAKGIPSMGIGNHCTIIKAIIDKDVRIGDSVSIINAHNLADKDDDNYCIRDGIIVIPKGSQIPSGTVI